MDVPDILQTLVEDGVIDDVRARLMSGKEASVFVVERRGELLAAKVYKDREQRTFKATASYTEGRNQTRNSRDKRAMGKRTSYGKELVEASWRDMEYAALHEAFMNGVRVPEPVLLYENVLLMELLVDEAGAPAPRLADFDLPADVAALLHREIYGQVRLLLRCGKIHGDLSAFNILIARDGPTIIDMPQVVDASSNNSAAEILRRDLSNVTEHLARFDSRLLLFRDCGSALWDHYRRGNIEHATEPEEGGLRRTAHQGHKGRRARDAERGRTGRARNGDPSLPPEPQARAHKDASAAPPRQRESQAMRDGRAPLPMRNDRGQPTTSAARDGRAPQQDNGRRHQAPRPEHGDSAPQQDNGRRPPAPGPRNDERPPHRARDDRAPPQRDDRGPPRTPPTRDGQAPTPHTRDRGQHAPRPTSDQRRPSQQHDERGHDPQRPMREDRAPQQREGRGNDAPTMRDSRAPSPRDGRGSQAPQRGGPQQEQGPRPQERRPPPVVERTGPQIERMPSGLPRDRSGRR